MKTVTLYQFLTLASIASSQFTNLPEVQPGLFNTSARIEIRSTKEAAWHALTDFANYADWNPFVRAAIVYDSHNVTLSDQVPQEGAGLFLRVQIPPLPLPVDSQTPDNPLHTQTSFETILTVDPDMGRLAWRYEPRDLLQAIRWQAVSDLGDGTILYESREVYDGILAPVVQESMEEGLQQSFEGQAAGLKLLLEGANNN